MSLEIREPKWFTIDLCCEFLDIKKSHFRNYIVPKLATHHVDKTSIPHHYFGRAVADVWRGEHKEKEETVQDTQRIQDARARKLEADADIKEIHRDELLNRLVQTTQVRAVNLKLSALMSDAANRLIDKYGEDAGAILQLAWDEFEEFLDETIPEPKPDPPVNHATDNAELTDTRTSDENSSDEL